MTLYEPKTLSQEIANDPELRQEVEREWFGDSTIITIEKKMEELGLTRSELARRMKCSPSNVTQLLRHGRSNLTLDTLMDLALAMEHRFLAPQLVPLADVAPWESCAALPVTFSRRTWIPSEELASSLVAWGTPQTTREEARPYGVSQQLDQCDSHVG